MECTRVRNILLENAERDIPREDLAAVEAHLAECRTCAALREALAEQSRVLASLPRNKAPAGLLQKVRREVEKPSLLKTLNEKISSVFGPGRFLQLAATTAVALIVVGTLRVSMQNETTQTTPVAPAPVPALQSPAPSPQTQPESALKSQPEATMPSRNIGEAVPPATRAPEPARESRTEATMPSPKVGKAAPPAARAPAPPRMAKALPDASADRRKELAPSRGMGGAPAPDLNKSTSPEAPVQASMTLTLRLPEAPMKQKAADSAAPPPPRAAAAPEYRAAPPPGAASRAEKAETAKKSAKSLRLSEDDIAPAPGDRRAIAAEVRRLISQANGRLVGPDSSRETDQPRELLAEIPSENYASFLTHLRELCAVEPDRKEDFRPLPGTTIRLTLKFSIP